MAFFETDLRDLFGIATNQFKTSVLNFSIQASLFQETICNVTSQNVLTCYQTVSV